MLRKDKVGKKVRISKTPKQEEYIDELKNYSKIKDKKIVLCHVQKFFLDLFNNILKLNCFFAKKND